MAMSSDTAPTCVVVRPGDAYAGKQGLSYVAGISAETVVAVLARTDPTEQERVLLHPELEAAVPR